MNGLAERLGASLCRAPYVWLVASVLAFVWMPSPLRVIATNPADASTPIAVVGTLLILSDVFLSLFSSSRNMASQLARVRSAKAARVG